MLRLLSPPVRPMCTVPARREHRYITAKNNFEYELTKLNKEAVGRAQRLLHYRPLPDKIFAIFSGTFEIFCVFKMFM